LPLNVGFGSLADIIQRQRHVRFTPDSGHSSVPVGCPKSANNGHRSVLLEPVGIYWDQASVLVQVGLIQDAKLPVAGVETAEKILDPNRPSNTLIMRTMQL
jgi:hypothetical protein